jgi:hypothetical protein
MHKSHMCVTLSHSNRHIIHLQSANASQVIQRSFHHTMLAKNSDHYFKVIRDIAIFRVINVIYMLENYQRPSLLILYELNKIKSK